MRGGWYGRPGQRRQRWVCKPLNGKAHRFTEALPRIVEDPKASHRCDSCATELEPWEGQPAPRDYGFTARHIAFALARVAAGASYRSTAAQVRELAHRELSKDAGKTAKGNPLPPANQHGQLVADWVEVFAPVLWAAHAPAAWPARVALDEMTFKLTHTRDEVTSRHQFSVLAASGYGDRGRAYIAAVEAVPRANRGAWRAFARRLDGQPEVAVTDGGIVAAAAAASWPDAQLRRCEWHLGRNLLDSLPETVRKDPAHPLRALLTGALRTEEGWDAYAREVVAHAASRRGFAGAVHRVQGFDRLVRDHIATRPAAGPHSTGQVEEFFRHLRQTIGDRAMRMSNKRRADALLLLLAAYRNGWVNEDRWAAVIHDRLLELRGQPPAQRRHTDRAAAPSLWG